MENENRNSRISNMNDLVNTDSSSSQRRVASSVRTGSTTQTPAASTRVRSIDVNNLDSAPRRTSGETGTRTSSPTRKKRPKLTKLDKVNNLLRVILVAFTALVLILVIIACSVLNSYIKSVAKGEATTVIAATAENFKSVDKLKSFIEANPDKVKSNKSIIGFDEKYYELIDGKDISFICCDNTETTQSYYIQASGKIVAQADLKLSDKTGSMGAERWELDKVDTSIAFSDVKSYSILVPEGSTVYVNGVLLDDDCITGTGVPEILKGSIQHIPNPPQFTTYTAKTLTDDLVVTGKDASGLDLVFSVTADSYVAGGKADQAFIDSVKKVVEAGLKEYALYFIYNAFNLNLYIINNSPLHDYIFGSDEYDPINPALYNYEWIKSFSFSEFEATNYTKYGDDCFTVDVKYKLDMVFDDDHPNMKDENQKLDATWVWVRDGDSWSISDSIVH